MTHRHLPPRDKLAALTADQWQRIARLYFEIGAVYREAGHEQEARDLEHKAAGLVQHSERLMTAAVRRAARSPGRDSA